MAFKKIYIKFFCIETFVKRGKEKYDLYDKNKNYIID